MKKIEVLGDGQIWDLCGIDKDNPEKTFEDLFSGRALEGFLNGIDKNSKRLFYNYLEGNKLRGMAVTKALLSKNQLKIKTAKIILEKLAKNGAKGIIAFDKGLGFKNWTKKEREYWTNIDSVIIGGGVSKDYTGKMLIYLIKNELKRNKHRKINIYQARFSGKESGFLGAAVNVLNEAFKNNNCGIKAIIGLDFGRDKIGCSFILADSKAKKVLEKNDRLWDDIIIDKTPRALECKLFLDSKNNFSKKEIILGKKIRSEILEKIVELIKINIQIINARKIPCCKYIGISMPGQIDKNGDIIGSTDYLPFLCKKDNFHFKKEIEKNLVKCGIKGFKVSVINDGIAAALANIYFDKRIKNGKVAFLGVGSGLGGFVGRVR